MKIPSINFPLYGIIIFISIVLGMIYISYCLKKEKYSNKNILLYFLMYIFFALVFGKFFTLIVNPTEGNILTIGLSSYGGLIGIIIAALVFEKILPTNKKIVRYSIVSLPLIYSVSKLACFFAGCCYGIPYNGILSVTYTDGLNIPLFPVQLLETIVFFIIFLICNKKRNSDNIIYLALLLGATFKFLLDFLRYDHLTQTITTNQIFSIFIVVVVICLLIFKKIRTKK